jgi:uncharacterized protein (TIGR03435 family)
MTIAWAFDLRQSQRSHLNEALPQWARGLKNAHDIDAVTSSTVSENECKLMTQRLLADRFQFAFHWEPKESALYKLVIAKGGSKLKKATEADHVTINLNGANTTWPAAGWTMEMLADFIANETDPIPVVNNTGLDGIYEIHLRYSNRVGRDRSDPEIYDAIQQQLGLKLEESRGPVSMFVVDHIAMPDPN